MKRVSLNYLERQLPAIRKRVSALPNVARVHGGEALHQQLIWLEIDVRSLRDVIYGLESQEELPLND